MLKTIWTSREVSEHFSHIQWNLSWETTDCHYMRPPVLRDQIFQAEGPTIQYNWTCHQRPPSWETLLWPMGQSFNMFKRGSAVSFSVNNHFLVFWHRMINLQTRKTAGTAENHARQQTPFCDIQIKVVILLLANISTPYRYPTTKNLSDLDFDLSRSVNVEFDDAIGFFIHVYAFLLMLNSNIGSNQALLRDIRLGKLSDLYYDLSRSLMVKCESTIVPPIYGLLLMFN